MNNRLLLTLKFVILFLLMIFLLIFNILPNTDCDACKAEVDGKVLSFERFLDAYYGKCLAFGNDRTLLDNLLNISINISSKGSLG